MPPKAGNHAEIALLDEWRDTEIIISIHLLRTEYLQNLM